MSGTLPRVLVIDDECGRQCPGLNRQRRDLCDALGLVDVSADSMDAGDRAPASPGAEAVFVRGQRPARAAVGDYVENDIEGVMVAVRRGWDLRTPGDPPWSMILLDLSFCTGSVTEESDAEQPGMAEGREGDLDPSRYFGLLVLERIRREFPDLPVAILSGQRRDQVDQEIDRLGHCGFISKTSEESRTYLRDLLQRHGLVPDPAGEIVGHSVGLLMALRDARRAASTSRNVLLRGERGTGKELVARYLHRSSSRADGPYVPINSGAVPESLSASELFGILPGTATQVTGNKGHLVRADGGYLFLDEIGNMPWQIQGELLRVIEDGIVTPVGLRKESDRRHVDVRFVSATNADLDGRVLAGTFRPDLLDRLRRGGTISLPPLRSRREDIPLLADVFLSRAVAETPDCQVTAISSEALDLLQTMDWPGNVRELEDCVHQAVLQHRDVRTLYPAQFEHVLSGFRRIVAHPSNGGSAEAAAGEEPVPSEGARPDLFLADADAPDRSQLRGSLVRARAEYARRVASLLREALVATRNIDGTFNMTGAVSWLRGERMRTTAAADEVKRLLKIDPAAIEDLMADPVLREVWDWAHRTRPSNPRKRRKGTGAT